MTTVVTFDAAAGETTERGLTEQEIADIQARAAAAATEMFATKIAGIKAEAQRRIGLLFGGKSGDALVFAEMNAIAAGNYPASQINAIRAASDAIEARLVDEPYLDPAAAPEWPEVE